MNSAIVIASANGIVMAKIGHFKDLAINGLKKGGIVDTLNGDTPVMCTEPLKHEEPFESDCNSD